jgi:NTP pyrophosphatase (non-canonical NTP hydrolase)
MNLNQYQKHAHATAIYPHKSTTQTLAYVALGLAGEAGEVANQVKKIIRDDKGKLTVERYKKLVDELGDCLWYLAEFCTVIPNFPTSLNSIALGNLKKLLTRKKQGKLNGDKRV